MELCSMLCGSLVGRGVWGRIDTRIWAWWLRLVRTSSAGDPGLISGWRRFPGEGNSNRLQYSCLENPMDRGAWQATVHEVAKSWTAWMTNAFTFRYMYLCGRVPWLFTWNSHNIVNHQLYSNTKYFKKCFKIQEPHKWCFSFTLPKSTDQLLWLHFKSIIIEKYRCILKACYNFYLYFYFTT